MAIASKLQFSSDKSHDIISKLVNSLRVTN